VTIRVLIADDEPPARARVRDLLAGEADVEVVGEAADGGEALERVKAERPDLLFLDVQMPVRDGFAVLRALGRRHSVTIFTTAHDEFAVRAFDVSAADYLLKPLRRSRFRAALAKARAALAAGGPALSAAELRRVVAEAVRSPAYLERLAVRVGRRIVVLRTAEVDWIEAEGNYARIHSGGRRYLLRQTLAGLEASLDPARFVRVHRSAIVSVDRIREMHPLAKGSHDLVLEGAPWSPPARATASGSRVSSAACADPLSLERFSEVARKRGGRRRTPSFAAWRSWREA
jgi:two-component system, LytTR family, response regulator